MKGFFQDKSCLLSPDQRINVPSTPFAIPDLTPKCAVASKVAMTPTIETSGCDSHDHFSHTDGSTIATSFPDSAHMNKLTPNYSTSYPPTSESEFEKLRKIDLSYLTLFRRSARFSNKGYNHFFLSQELKCDDHFLSPSAHDQNNLNGGAYSTDSAANSHGSVPPNYRRNTSSTTLNSNGVQSNGNMSTKSVDSHAIYNMAFSHDGKYLASAGADGLIRIWEVITSEMDRHSNNFHSLNIPVKPHRKSFIENALDDTLNDLGSIINGGSEQRTSKSYSKSRRNTLDSYDSANTNESKPNSHFSSKNAEYAPVFKSKPVKTFYHDRTVNSLDWSKNNFLLSSSEDGTAKLWHVDRADCLQTYKFDSIVTCAKFHKTDDRFFVASQWNGRVLFLSILEKEVIYEVNLNKSITCFDFCPNSKRLFVGCDKGYIFTLKIDGGLIVESDYQIKRKHNMPRITGIVTFIDDTKDCLSDPAKTPYNKSNTSSNNKTNNESELPMVKVLISCNDSKIRLFNFTEKFLEVRYSGYTNKASTISASLNEDKTHVISGSDDGWTYIWQLYSDKRNKIENEKKLFTKAHFDLLNYFKDDTCLIDNKYYGSFHTHNNRCNVSLFAPRASLKLLELSNDPIFDLKHQYSSLVTESHIKDLEIDDLSTALIVSTDNTGKIKVFRRDFSRYIRKALQGKKASQLLDRKQSVLSRGMSKKVLNRNSLVIPNYEATTMNIADTMSSIYMDADATVRGRGKKGYLRPANKFAVESSIIPDGSNANGSGTTKASSCCKSAKPLIPKVNIEKQQQQKVDGNSNTNMITSTPDVSTSSYSGKTSYDEMNNSTLRGIQHNHSVGVGEDKLTSLPLRGGSSSVSSTSYSSSSKNSIQVSDSVKNIDDEIKKVLVQTPHVGVVHQVGQKQHSHSNTSLSKSEEGGQLKGNVYIERATHQVEDGGVKESQVVSIPLDVGSIANRRAEGWSDVGDGKYTCSKCQSVNFTPHPMTSGTTNQIKFYCDDCGQEAKIE